MSGESCSPEQPARKQPPSVIASLPRYLSSRPWKRGLLLSEYRTFGLDSRPAHDARDHLGALGAARLALKLNRVSNRRGLVSDKMLFDAMLRGSDLPVPDLKGVFGRPNPPNTIRVFDKDSLRRLLTAPGALPLFGKPAQGQRSEDALAVMKFNAPDDSVGLIDGTMLSLESLLSHLRQHHRTSGYLFQSYIRQHPAITKITGPTIATLRLVTLMQQREFHVLGAMWKIPRPGMTADNTWRGNMIADVGITTGRVGPALTGLTAHAGRMSKHPDTNAVIAGFTIPHWDDLLQKTRRAAGLIHVLPLIGWDIAITENGPLFVEANTSPSLDALQITSGRGTLFGASGKLLQDAALEISRQKSANKRLRRDRRRKRVLAKFGLR